MPAIGSIKALEVQLKSVLVATDFSLVSEKALRHAVVVARHYHSKLFLMHVISSLGFTMAGPDSSVSAFDLAERDLKKVEQQLMLSGALTGLDHEAIVQKGEIWEEIETIVAEKSIGMIVVGTHSRTGISKLVLGSVAEQIFRHSSCPVLTVGPHCPTNAEMSSPEAPRPLLFPTDFSDDSLRALPHAVSFANEQKTWLVLLHVLGSVPEVHDNRWYTAQDVVRYRKAAQSESINRLHDLVRSVGLAIEPLCIAEFGDPADGILRTAKRICAEAIIMGLKPKAHIDAITHLPWSTAYKVVCDSECAVLTVRR